MCFDLHHFAILCIAVTVPFTFAIIQVHLAHGSQELSICERSEETHVVLDLLLQLLFGTWVVEGSCAEVVGGVFLICGVAIILIRESQGLD